MYTPLPDDALPTCICNGHLPPRDEVHAREKISVSATGLPFNSVLAVEVTR
jgi:hypothetical protein